jgi:hypothetical protein
MSIFKQFKNIKKLFFKKTRARPVSKQFLMSFQFISNLKPRLYEFKYI